MTNSYRIINQSKTAWEFDTSHPRKLEPSAVTLWNSQVSYLLQSLRQTNKQTDKRTNCTVQSASWEATISSASQEISRILCNPKVNYSIHTRRQLSIPSTRSIQSMPPHPISCKYILILSSYIITKYQSKFEALCEIFRNIVKILRWGVLSNLPNPQAGISPLVGCPRLLTQHNRTYPPHLEAVRPSETWGWAMLG